MLAKVTSKGQVTIPVDIRKKLGIHSEDTVDFIIEEGRVVLIPVKTLKDMRGAVATHGKGDPSEERNKAKSAVASRMLEEMK